MEGSLSSLIATIPAGNVAPLFIIIINMISISFVLLKKGKSVSSPQRAFDRIVSKGGPSNMIR